MSSETKEFTITRTQCGECGGRLRKFRLGNSHVYADCKNCNHTEECGSVLT